MSEDWYTISDRQGGEWLMRVSNKAAWLTPPRYWHRDGESYTCHLKNGVRLKGGYRLWLSHIHALTIIARADWRYWRDSRHYRRRARFIRARRSE